MRFLGWIAVASLGMNLIATNASASWTQMSGAGTAHRIAVEPTAERHVWKILSGDVYEYVSGSWTQRGGSGLSASRIALPPDPSNNNNKPWIINSSQQLRRWNGSSFDAAVANGGGIDVAVGSGSTPTVWVVGGNNQVYTWNGSAWGQPDGGTRKNVSSIAIDASGVPWIVDSSQAIFRWNGSTAFVQTLGGGKRAGAAAVQGGNNEFYFADTSTNPISWGNPSAAPGTPTTGNEFSRGGNVLWAIGDASELYRCVFPNCW